MCTTSDDRRTGIKVIRKICVKSKFNKNSFDYIDNAPSMSSHTQDTHWLVDTMAVMECNFAINNVQMNMICESADGGYIGMLRV